MSDASDQRDILDVRVIPPARRHPMIFQRFAELPVGGGFTLVNDHDPKPLYYQLNFEHNGELGWDYLEQGPEVWRVRISRTAADGPKRQIPLRTVTRDAE